MSGNIFDGSIRSELKEFLTKDKDAKDAFISSVESFFLNWNPNSADDVIEWIYRYPQDSIPPLKKSLENNKQTKLLENINAKASEWEKSTLQTDTEEEKFLETWKRLYGQVDQSMPAKLAALEAKFDVQTAKQLEQDAKIDKQNAIIDEQSEKISEQDRKIDQQSAEISKQDKKIDDQNAKLSEQDKKISALMEQVTALEDEIREKNRQIEEMRVERENLLKDKDENQDNLMKIIDGKDTKIRELEERLKDITQSRDALQTKVEKKRIKLAEERAKNSQIIYDMIGNKSVSLTSDISPPKSSSCTIQ